MTVTAKQLRIEPGKILSHVEEGIEYTVTYRGRPCAKIVPIEAAANESKEERQRRHKKAADHLFGMWADRTDMDDPDAWLAEQRGKRMKELEKIWSSTPTS
jgi:prevent-host-death family protein